MGGRTSSALRRGQAVRQLYLPFAFLRLGFLALRAHAVGCLFEAARFGYFQCLEVARVSSLAQHKRTDAHGEM